MLPAEDPVPFLETYSSSEHFRRYRAPGMGTENVLLLGVEARPAGGVPQGALDRAALDRAAQEAFDLLGRLERRLSKFLPESEVSEVNAAAASRPVAVSDDLFLLLERSREAWELSGGAFDPTVAPLMAAWGFADGEGRVPAGGEIDAALACRGMDLVELEAERGTVRFARPGVAIDLGGIAKGFAADRMAAGLRARGVPFGAVISGRSSVVTWGTAPGDEGGWRFEVAHPGSGEAAGEPVAALRAAPGAVSSSGASERRFRRGGKDYGHVLDPRSGRPAERVFGATVWTETGLLGDVLSTVLFVRGLEALEAPGAGAGGGLPELARRWSASPQGEGRFSALVIEADPGVWGGLGVRVVHRGPPGFVVDPGGAPA
jgi:thiamine biosynthesis lipoprotein